MDADDPTHVGCRMDDERWLITGASGQLGGYVLRLLSGVTPQPKLLAWTHRHSIATPQMTAERIDLADKRAVQGSVAAFRPTVIVHLGAVTAVGEAHANPDLARRVNVDGTRFLLQAAEACGARLVYGSTDMVFDGTAAPYRETDPPRPLSDYGRSKLAAEQLVTGAERALVARLPLMYGLPLTDRPTTFATQLAALRAHQPLRLFVDEHRTPLWFEDAARALVALGRSGETGILHVAGPERLSRYDLLARCADLLGIENPAFEAVSRLDVAASEPRPADLSLCGARFVERFPDCAPGPVRGEAFD